MPPLVLTIVFLCLGTAIRVFSAVPTLENLFPAGGRLGSTFTITAVGKLDPWPVKLWVDCAGVEFKPGTNAGQFTVTITPDAPVGPHLVRAYNADGASEARTFLIGRFAEVAEKEPNDSMRQAQHVEPLPAVINGRLEKPGDVDSFAVRVEAGRWLVAAVDGFALGAPMDPFLHLLDEHGTKLALSADSHNLDPFIAFKAERTGIYILQLAAFIYPPGSDVRLHGSAACIYRLTLSDAPLARHTFPAGAQRGRKSTVQLTGWNLDSKSAPVTVDAASAQPLADQVNVSSADADRALPVLLGDFPELVEREPNHTVTNAQRITPPCVMNGRIDPSGDVDRFSFSANKGERFYFRLRGESLQSQLDAWLRIEDHTGKQLAYSDDSATGLHDPTLLWTAPTNGTFSVAIGDLYRKGTPEYRYRLEIVPPLPDFRVTADAQVYAVGRGQTNVIKLTIVMQNGGFTNLVTSVTGLPEGVTVKPVEISTKGGEVKLTLVASEEAKPASAPIQIMVAVRDSNPVKSRMAAFNLKTVSNVGELLINQTEHLWLTVTVGTPTVPPPSNKKKGNIKRAYPEVCVRVKIEREQHMNKTKTETNPAAAGPGKSHKEGKAGGWLWP